MIDKAPFMAALAAVCLLGLPAMAQEDAMKTLTPVKVRELVDKMTEKTKPGGRLNDDQVVQYLQAHLSDQGSFRSTLTYRIPGYDDQVQEVSISKEQFIQNVLAGRRDIRKYDSDVKVKDITISRDKRSALFQIVTREKGEMPVEPKKYLPFVGESICEQELRITGDIPQIYTAACTSLIEVKQR